MNELRYFPLLVWNIFRQLLLLSISEVEMFLLASIGILLAIKLGVLWGLTIYLTIYFANRMIGGYVSLLAASHRSGNRQTPS